MEHVPTFGGTPQARRRRWPRIISVAIAALAVLVGAGFATGLVRVYDAPGNAGIVAGWTCTNLGYEWKGDPGLFANSCS